MRFVHNDSSSFIIFTFSRSFDFYNYPEESKKMEKAGLIRFFDSCIIYGFSLSIPLLPPPEPTGNMEVLTDMIFYRYKSEIPEMLTHVDERKYR